MRQIYTNQWTSKWASSTEVERSMRKWGQTLADLSGEEIRRGIDNCAKNCERPPTPARFLRVSGHQPKSGNPAHKAYVALPPRPEPDKAKAKASIARMRYAMGHLAFCDRWQEVHGMRRYGNNEPSRIRHTGGG